MQCMFLSHPDYSLFSQVYFLEPYSSSWPWDWTFTWRSLSSWLSLLFTQLLVSLLPVLHSMLLSAQHYPNLQLITVLILSLSREGYPFISSVRVRHKTRNMNRKSSKQKKKSPVLGVSTLIEESDILCLVSWLSFRIQRIICMEGWDEKAAHRLKMQDEVQMNTRCQAMVVGYYHQLRK